MSRLDRKRAQVLKVLRQWHALGGRSSLTVGQLMTPCPSCIRPQMFLDELVRLFHERGFRHFLVTDADDRLCGLVSDRDVLRWLGPGDEGSAARLSGTPVSKVMSTDLLTASPQTSLTEALETMVTHGISSLPVLDNERLVGILTNTDLDLLLLTVLEAWFDQAPLADAFGS